MSDLEKEAEEFATYKMRMSLDDFEWPNTRIIHDAWVTNDA